MPKIPTIQITLHLEEIPTEILQKRIRVMEVKLRTPQDRLVLGGRRTGLGCFDAKQQGGKILGRQTIGSQTVSHLG